MYLNIDINIFKYEYIFLNTWVFMKSQSGDFFNI